MSNAETVEVCVDVLKVTDGAVLVTEHDPNASIFKERSGPWIPLSLIEDSGPIADGDKKIYLDVPKWKAEELGLA